MHFCYPYGMIGLRIGGIGMIGMMHFTDYGMIYDICVSCKTNSKTSFRTDWHLQLTKR